MQTTTHLQHMQDLLFVGMTTACMLAKMQVITGLYFAHWSVHLPHLCWQWQRMHKLKGTEIFCMLWI